MRLGDLQQQVLSNAYAEPWSYETVAAMSVSQTSGLVLTTKRFEPIYINRSALEILGYPDLTLNQSAGIQQRIREIVQATELSDTCAPANFLSGRRWYSCRFFVMESRTHTSNGSVVALLFDRRARDPLEMSEIVRRFRLSTRESETVRHLIHGRTTKEVAQHMGVSPNTVKQFIRFAMSKMGVTTRSAIVGKVLRHDPMPRRHSTNLAG